MSVCFYIRIYEWCARNIQGSQCGGRVAPLIFSKCLHGSRCRKEGTGIFWCVWEKWSLPLLLVIIESHDPHPCASFGTPYIQCAFKTIQTLISFVEGESVSTAMRKLSLVGLLLFNDNDEKGSTIIESKDKMNIGFRRLRINSSPTIFHSLKTALLQNGISTKKAWNSKHQLALCFLLFIDLTIHLFI